MEKKKQLNLFSGAEMYEYSYTTQTTNKRRSRRKVDRVDKAAAKCDNVSTGNYTHTDR